MTTAIKTLSAIIYDRKSRGEDGDLARRKQDLVDLANGLGATKHKYFGEVASSKNNDREDYLNVIIEIKSGKHDFLIIPSLSRITRDFEEQIKLLKLLTNNDMVIHSLTDGVINPADTANKMLAAIKGLFNEYEFEETSKKMHFGRLSSARKGKWVGVPPYGYKKNKETLILVHDEIEAPIARRIFMEVIEGYSITDISVRLHRDGIKTRKGKNFHPSTISNLLERRTYIGETSFKSDKFGEEVTLKNTHEPIVSLEEFLQVRSILANKQHFQTRTHEITSPLDKLIFCKKCRRLMQVNLAKKKYVHLQKCNAYKYGERCENSGASLNHILPLVYQEVKKRQNIIREQLEKLKAGSSNDRLANLEKDLKGIKKQLKNKETEKDDLLNFLLRKVIPETVYVNKNKELEEEIKRLQQRENDTVEAIANSNVENDVEFLEGLLRHIENLETKSVDEQNRILKKVIDKIVYEREGNHLDIDIQFKE
jgi:site-specific DNA recombinase